MSVRKVVKEVLKEIWRKPLMWRMQRRLRVKNLRIVASMCVGGILSHDLNLQFLSPTINLTIPRFVDFCEELQENMNREIVHTGDSQVGYPLAKVGKCTICGVHYRSFGELKQSWERRTERFRSGVGEIVLMASDAEVRTAEDIERFHKLPYRKVCFTSRDDIPYGEFIYLPEFQGQKVVGDILRYTDVWGTRIFEKNFDCVGWLNNDTKER